MEKKEYEALELEIVRFTAEDVITASAEEAACAEDTEAREDTTTAVECLSYDQSTGCSGVISVSCPFHGQK